MISNFLKKDKDRKSLSDVTGWVKNIEKNCATCSLNILNITFTRICCHLHSLLQQKKKKKKKKKQKQKAIATKIKKKEETDKPNSVQNRQIDQLLVEGFSNPLVSSIVTAFVAVEIYYLTLFDPSEQWSLIRRDHWWFSLRTFLISIFNTFNKLYVVAKFQKDFFSFLLLFTITTLFYPSSSSHPFLPLHSQITALKCQTKYFQTIYICEKLYLFAWKPL